MQIRRTLDVATFTHDEVVEALTAYARQKTGRTVESIWISTSNTDHRGTLYELSARLRDQPESK